MYLLRGIVVSLAAFFLVYVVLSGILVCVWRMWGRKFSIQSAPSLYGIRLVPLIFACGLVALFTVPSFLYLEPYFPGEKIGARAFVLAVAGAGVLLAGLLNGASALVRTSKLLRVCLAHSCRRETSHRIRACEVPEKDPVLFVAGVWRPKLVVSSGTLALLDADEIQAAVQHEMAHVNRGDNWKKLLLQFCALPGLGSLEREWLRAAEEAADDAAAADPGAALALASALIKMARVSSRRQAPELGMTLVPQNGASVSARVQRLLSGTRSRPRNNRILWWTLLASAALAVSVNYAWVLMQVHEVTELLLR